MNGQYPSISTAHFRSIINPDHTPYIQIYYIDLKTFVKTQCLTQIMVSTSLVCIQKLRSGKFNHLRQSLDLEDVNDTTQRTRLSRSRLYAKIIVNGAIRPQKLNPRCSFGDYK